MFRARGEKFFFNFSPSVSQQVGLSVSIPTAHCQEVLRSLAARCLRVERAGGLHGEWPAVSPHDSSESGVTLVMSHAVC